jgi:hypothetical protein
MNDDMLELSPRDAEGIGILIVHQLNTLFSYTCCRRCCAPCGYLWDLAQDGDKLEIMMSQAPEPMWRDWLFSEYDRTSDDPPGAAPYKPQVREKDGRLSRKWLDSRMQGMDNEPCTSDHSWEMNDA